MKILLLLFILLLSKNVHAEETVIDNIAYSFGLDGYISSIDEYLQNEELDISSKDIYDSLLNNQKVEKKSIIKAIVGTLTKEIKSAAKSIASIYLIIIIYMLLNSIAINKSSEVVKVTNIIISSVVVIILFRNFKEILDILKSTTKIVTYFLELTTTFLTGVLVATGKLNGAVSIEPIILGVNSAIPLVTNYIVIPLLTISVVIKIVSQIAVEMKLEKLAKTFRKSAIYIFSTLCTIFILVMSLESGVSKNIDSIYFKTTQNVIKDSVPVVGGIFADSLDTVIGASELISKTGGTVAIISLLLLVCIPIIKIVISIALYSLLIAISEPVDNTNYLTSIIEHFVSVYKEILGIIIGICIIFVSSVGIIMNMFNSL